MKKTIALVLTLGLAACGDDAKVSPVAAIPVSRAVAAPIEAPKPDPDQELAKRVSRAMEDGKLHGVDVVAAAGIVTLWGAIPSARERDRASEIARNVEGVSAVENRLQVVSGS